MLIGITGKARSGKNTVADYLSEEYNTQTFAFGDAVKKTAAEMFGIPLDCFYADALKEKIHEYWGISPREMVQKVGTEGGRYLFGDDLWIKRIAFEVTPWLNSDCCAGVVIADVRFENEADWVREQGGVIFHVRRDEAEGAVRPHVSEDGIEEKTGDCVINNNGSLRTLYAKLNLILPELLTR